MDYIYDIVLNFKEKYYDFYEWHKTDKLINIKKVPIYKISTKDYLKIKNNIVRIDRNSLPKNNKMFLITSGIEVMGILIDNKGKVIKKSSLIFEEADDILSDKDEIKYIGIKYQIISLNKALYISRINEEKNKYIDKYLKNINPQKEEYFLKYLYYDIYNKEEKNIDIIYKTLIKLSKENLNKLYIHLKKVNDELKK